MIKPCWLRKRWWMSRFARRRFQRMRRVNFARITRHELRAVYRAPGGKANVIHVACITSRRREQTV